jgi:hypothetical protein
VGRRRGTRDRGHGERPRRRRLGRAAAPAKPAIVEYASSAFTAAEQIFGGVRDDELLLPTADFDEEGGWVVLRHFGWHLIHASRHLGMVEALKGVHGFSGTVTV